MGDLTNLHTLTLSYNKLPRLPSSFSRLTQLITIGLTGNYLTSFPIALLECQQLKFIDIGGNRIRKLPDLFTRLENLEKLIMNDNRFRIFPLSVMACTRLRNLEIDDNRITHIDALYHPTLKKLHLHRDGDDQCSLYDRFELHMPNLRALLITTDKHGNIPVTIHASTNKLHTLYVTNPPLSNPRLDISLSFLHPFLTNLHNLRIDSQYCTIPASIHHAPNLNIILKANCYTSEDFQKYWKSQCLFIEEERKKVIRTCFLIRHYLLAIMHNDNNNIINSDLDDIARLIIIHHIQHTLTLFTIQFPLNPTKVNFTSYDILRTGHMPDPFIYYRLYNAHIYASCVRCRPQTNLMHSLRL
jgi:Leucine-rich repeat (LRR) protein